MTVRARWMVAVAALLMAVAYVLPLWRVDLIAPQYPEGLGMYIRIAGVEGLKPNDLNSINNLNHYIGMKAIVPEAIPELRWMPWILGALIVSGLGVAARGRRLALHLWGGTLALLLVAGLYDFWRWGYDYGHDLDEEMAIIKVPGMTYQPPLIGSKKLLNFRATSWPSGGGIALGLAAGLVALAVVDTRRRGRGMGGEGRTGKSGAPAATSLGVLLLVSALACGQAMPRALVIGEEACDFCKMRITDPRFGGQVILTTGRQIVFDSPECLVGFLDANAATSIASVWVLDAEHPNGWVRAESAGFLADASLRGPMGRVTAFASPEAARTAQVTLGGTPVSWEAIRSDSARLVAGAH